MSRIARWAAIGGTGTGTGLAIPTIRSVTGDTTTQSGDLGNIVLHLGSGTYTHNLEEANAVYYTVVNGSDNPLAIVPSTGTVSGAASMSLPPRVGTSKPSITLLWKSATTDWIIVGRSNPPADGTTISDVSGELTGDVFEAMLTALNAGSGVTPLAGDVVLGGTLSPDGGVTPGTPKLMTLPTTSASLFDMKDSVKVATTANITLSGEQTIDGVTTSASRVLVKNQTTGSQNGIYVSGAGAWTRATDADSSAEMTAGVVVPVEGGGTVNGGRIFILTTSGTVTLGTTALTFSRVDSGDLATADIGVTVQAYSATLALLAALSTTSFGRSFLTAADAAAAQALVGEVFVFALSDDGPSATAITTGVAKQTWRAPYAFTITAVRASLSTASSSGIPTVDINEGGTTILSTKLTIDAGEKTSTTAAAAPVLSDTSLADDAEITFDIDVAGTGAKGLKVSIYGHRT